MVIPPSSSKMAGIEDTEEPPRKRLKTEGLAIQINGRSPLTLSTPISPPDRRKSPLVVKTEAGASGVIDLDASNDVYIPPVIPSPVHLTWIQDLPASENVDALTLKDILGDPLISDCWEFNFLHDIDFLMDAFDSDVKDLVKVHIIHGFWKQGDAAGLMIKASNRTNQPYKTQAEKYTNVTTHTAYMAEAYGVHHTKMMVLFRHDGTAQVIIHTANLIPKDWCNLTQAVWRSPLLPLLDKPDKSSISSDHVVGSGQRFKVDFLNYCKSYNTRRDVCRRMVDDLSRYDFSSIKGMLIGSVPGRHSVEMEGRTLWGWPAMRHALRNVPSHNKGVINTQVSSIATLGVTDTWLSKTLFAALSSSNNGAKPPENRIIFPTVDEVRRSHDGYDAGASIHIKTKSAAQQKQLQYLKPLLHHWTGDGNQHDNEPEPKHLAGRRRAAPHIKTYIRLADDLETIDWALMTSANMSKQAWGEAVNGAGNVRIQSYELGVLVWPGLWDADAVMVPSFKKNIPEKIYTQLDGGGKMTIGFRMPYDLPLRKYAAGDLPWDPNDRYTDPDWKGQTWNDQQ